MAKEIWKKIPEYKDYQVSTLGRVRSSKNNWIKVLKPKMTKQGYELVHLRNNGNNGLLGVSRLVLLTFVSPPLEGEEASHLNGIHTDNRLCNLKWETFIENRRRIKGFRRLSIKIFNFRIMIFVEKEK